mmetsp:Transcript_67219/g.158469  ORF Transcript_67219/g.158469 Transcript_67219/m.158469 type:complete len:206 (-) Transcript_67219:405-1022(-)
MTRNGVPPSSPRGNVMLKEKWMATVIMELGAGGVNQILKSWTRGIVRTSSPSNQRLPSTATLLASMTRTRKMLLLLGIGVAKGTCTVNDHRNSSPALRASGFSSGSWPQGRFQVRRISWSGSQTGSAGFGSGSPTIGRPKQPLRTESSWVQLGIVKSSGASKTLEIGQRIWYSKGAAMWTFPPQARSYRSCSARNMGTSAPATPV